MADLRTGTVHRRVTRCCLGVTALALIAGGAAAQTAPPSLRVTAENIRVNSYLHDLAGAGAIIGVLGGGLMDGLREKNPDVESVAGRMGSRMAQAAVQVSVRHGLAALMHRSTDYQPCGCTGFGPKVEHALLETFTDRRADGSRALSVPRLGGAYAGSFARLASARSRFTVTVSTRNDSVTVTSLRADSSPSNRNSRDEDWVRS